MKVDGGEWLFYCKFMNIFFDFFGELGVCDWLFDVVEVLIYLGGIYVIGVDVIVKWFGVVWKSFYLYFELKEVLVVVVFECCDECWMCWFVDVMLVCGKMLCV